jgi:nucleotide-binding universal stress UspA family protein
MDFRHILVPTDFGEPSARAVNLGIELAVKFEAKLTLLHAYEVPLYTYPQAEAIVVDLFTPIEQAAREQLNSALASVQQKLPQAKAILRSGVPWREILSAVEEVAADVVVMGTHGRRGVTHALLGSVAEKIVRLSPVPVLTVRDTVG